MSSIPPELRKKILAAIATDTDCDSILDDFIKLLVRENRIMRQQILELWRDFKTAADREDVEYTDSLAAGAAQFTCEHIINDIIKPRVYVRDEDEDDEWLMEDLFEEDE